MTAPQTQPETQPETQPARHDDAPPAAIGAGTILLRVFGFLVVLPAVVALLVQALWP